MTAAFGPPRSWWEDDPDRVRFEKQEMGAVAPSLKWLSGDAEPSCGWTGPLPLWPFNRPEPADLRQLATTPLEVRIVYGHAYPVVEPHVTPLNVTIPIRALGWTTWHVLPDGALCLLQDSATWDPRCPAADLVPKACGWYLEYLLMLSGHIDTMTESGIVTDASLDETITEAAHAAQ